MRQNVRFVRKLTNCFNPRTHEGCDSKSLYCDAYRTLFQSTHPRGVRLAALNSFTLVRLVSIHAPTRGATTQMDIDRADMLFQSTHPRGVRLRQLSISTLLACFNPRTHEGCDHRPHNYKQKIGVSIHAPTRGATLSTLKTWVTGQFQSTHPRGVRLTIRSLMQMFGSFNPRTHEGCDFG